MAKSFGLKIPEKQTNHLTGFTKSSVLHNSSSFLHRLCLTILVIVGLQHFKNLRGLGSLSALQGLDCHSALWVAILNCQSAFAEASKLTTERKVELMEDMQLSSSESS